MTATRRAWPEAVSAIRSKRWAMPMAGLTRQAEVHWPETWSWQRLQNRHGTMSSARSSRIFLPYSGSQMKGRAMAIRSVFPWAMSYSLRAGSWKPPLGATSTRAPESLMSWA